MFHIITVFHLLFTSTTRGAALDSFVKAPAPYDYGYWQYSCLQQAGAGYSIEQCAQACNNHHATQGGDCGGFEVWQEGSNGHCWLFLKPFDELEANCGPFNHNNDCDKYDRITDCNLDPTICSANAQCVDNAGQYECECNDGFTGDGTTQCSDINECETENICGAGSCVNNAGGYSCNCNNGYDFDGITCVDINECDDPAIASVCGAGAECVNTMGGYECQCSYVTITCGDNESRDCREINGDLECRCVQTGNILPVFFSTHVIEIIGALLIMNILVMSYFNFCKSNKSKYQRVKVVDSESDV